MLGWNGETNWLNFQGVQVPDHGVPPVIRFDLGASSPFCSPF